MVKVGGYRVFKAVQIWMGWDGMEGRWSRKHLTSVGKVGASRSWRDWTGVN